MKPKISIIIPGIRNYNWPNVCASIHNSLTCQFEVIFVGPYALPTSLQDIKNVKYCKDFGNPVRCSDIGLSLAEGELLAWQADDGTFFPGMMDKALSVYENMTPDAKNVMILKYCESTMINQPDSYYNLSRAYIDLPNIEKHWWIFNFVIMKTAMLLNIR